MYSATLTSQGQITIPSKIRALLNLKEGDQITLIPQSDISLLISKTAHFSDLRGILKHAQKVQNTYTEEDMGSRDYKNKWLKNDKNSG